MTERRVHAGIATGKQCSFGRQLNWTPAPDAQYSSYKIKEFTTIVRLLYPPRNTNARFRMTLQNLHGTFFSIFLEKQFLYVADDTGRGKLHSFLGRGNRTVRMECRSIVSRPSDCLRTPLRECSVLAVWISSHGVYLGVLGFHLMRGSFKFRTIENNLLVNVY